MKKLLSLLTLALAFALTACAETAAPFALRLQQYNASAKAFTYPIVPVQPFSLLAFDADKKPLTLPQSTFAHANIATLNKITESDGLPLWNGAPWPGGGAGGIAVWSKYLRGDGSEYRPVDVKIAAQSITHLADSGTIITPNTSAEFLVFMPLNPQSLIVLKYVNANPGTPCTFSMPIRAARAPDSEPYIITFNCPDDGEQTITFTLAELGVTPDDYIFIFPFQFMPEGTTASEAAVKITYFECLTGKEGVLAEVFHDESLTGKGTPDNPLKVGDALASISERDGLPLWHGSAWPGSGAQSGVFITAIAGPQGVIAAPVALDEGRAVVAIGTWAKVRNNGVAIGENSIAGDRSVGIGSFGYCEGLSSVAIGDNAKVDEFVMYAVAIGRHAWVRSGATGSMAFGENATVSAANSITFASGGWSRANAVNFGNRTVTGADATASNDFVTKAQLDAVIAKLQAAGVAGF